MRIGPSGLPTTNLSQLPSTQKLPSLRLNFSFRTGKRLPLPNPPSETTFEIQSSASRPIPHNRLATTPQLTSYLSTLRLFTSSVNSNNTTPIRAPDRLTSLFGSPFPTTRDPRLYRTAPHPTPLRIVSQYRNHAYVAGTRLSLLLLVLYPVLTCMSYSA